MSAIDSMLAARDHLLAAQAHIATASRKANGSDASYMATDMARDVRRIMESSDYFVETQREGEP